MNHIARSVLLRPRIFKPSYTCPRCQRTTRTLGTRAGTESGSPTKSKPNAQRLIWKPIPIGLGIAFLGVLQLYRIRRREAENGQGANDTAATPARKRPRPRPEGPWQIQVMSYLPLKALSRLWGRFNELTIPHYLREPGFRFYAWIFGANLSEMANQDLTSYPNLASFFYRSLKHGVRPLDPDPMAILSPADGRVLQYGTIEHGEVAQVKGVKYRLDALLGGTGADAPAAPDHDDFSKTPQAHESTHTEEHFARDNGISYTLPNIFSTSDSTTPSSTTSTLASAARSLLPRMMTSDASTRSKKASETAVSADLALANDHSTWNPFSSGPKPPTNLYYIVIYLAPGDYHRFHSPAAWVVERRRHFAGELYSVSPYLQRTLPGLFTLNERVVLLGRWRWGFFSFCPVGATNVGSIKLDFDSELRTNSLTTDTAADRAAEEASNRGEPYSGYSEATYAAASRLLRGHALQRGEEMGGFQLGSSIVIVFEAPKGVRVRSFDEGWQSGPVRRGGWKWKVEQGQRVKVGEAIGFVEDEQN